MNYMSKQRCLQEPPGSSTERPVLLCLPHAGGNATFFRSWHTVLADAVDVVALEIAGHGARRNEQLPRTLGEALDSVWNVVVGYCDRRHVLFGHSLGALYAFEIAHRLSRRGCPPELLLVSGRNAPGFRAEVPDCHRLPDTEFIDRLVSYGGIPAEIAKDPALMKLFLPALRADMRITERYTRGDQSPLRCPITIFYGEKDPLVSRAGVEAWCREASQRCEIITLPGGHFGPPDERLRRVRQVVLSHFPAAVNGGPCWSPRPFP